MIIIKEDKVATSQKMLSLIFEILRDHIVTKPYNHVVEKSLCRNANA